MTDFERIVHLAEDARYNRSYGQPPVEPTINELERLASKKDRLNGEGSTQDFIDAQAEFIDALLVALEIASAPSDPIERERFMALADFSHAEAEAEISNARLVAAKKRLDRANA